MAAEVNVVTITVRHSAQCKYAKDAYSRRCDCRKTLVYYVGGVRQRKTCNTRSWAEAERQKDELEDQLAGRAPESATAKPVTDAVGVFLTDKRNQGVSETTIGRYELELDRFVAFATAERVFTVQAVNRELLTKYAATWSKTYAPLTQTKVRERLKTFLRYAHDAGWLKHVPQIATIKVTDNPTLPLTDEEFSRILNSFDKAKTRRSDGKPESKFSPEMETRIRALILLMRWSGLSIGDAFTLERDRLFKDRKGLHRVVTQRMKTGSDVSVPIPAEVAKTVTAVNNENPKYIFWTGVGRPNSTTKTLTTRYIRPLFKAANVECEGHMVSHRLRDTFACDLLSKGVPLEEVSKLLGHKSIKTTERSYGAWVKSRQDRTDDLVIGTWE